MRSAQGFLLLAPLVAACIAPLCTAAARLDRTVLPIPEPETPAITEQDARKATAPSRFEVKAPGRRTS